MTALRAAPRIALLTPLLLLLVACATTMGSGTTSAPRGPVPAEPAALPEPVYDPAPEAPGGAPGAASDLTVMTFNVRYGRAKDGANAWDARRPIVTGMLRGQRADVIGFQEPTQKQTEQLLRSLRDYAPAAMGRTRKGRVAGKQGIFFRTSRLELLEDGQFWFSETPDVSSPTFGGGNPRICTWARFHDRRSGARFYVYNVHLDPTNARSRKLSVELLAQRISARRHGSNPVVLLGDFNDPEQGRIYQYLTGAATDTGSRTGRPLPTLNLVDTFRKVHPTTKDCATFHGFRGGTKGIKIDHVFVTSDVTVVDAAIVRDAVDGRYPSDHYPVTARIRFGR